MVIGILGPSLPAMVADLGISYAQAGFFFTLLSLGSFIGTSLGGIGSDHLPRKALFAGCVLALSVGLCVLGFMPGYFLIALVVFLLSLLGSPIGAIGQSIMLGMFPGKRERYLAFMTMFSATGSFLAPLLVSLNFTLALSWRWTFFETSLLAFVVFVAVVAVRIPPAAKTVQRTSFLTILKCRGVILCAILIFFSVGSDLGFSYWLAQYFKSELHVSLRLASSVVGMYLAGVICGRLLLSVFLKKIRPRTILLCWLGIALAAIMSFILVPVLTVKALLCIVYGFGIAPVFPLLVARGTAEFPTQAGAVTGVLYGAMSLGGMVFPLLVGTIAAKWGIGTSYFLCALIVCVLLAAVLRMKEPHPRTA
jgi:predicted MFS family arabinose efflux permease